MASLYRFRILHVASRIGTLRTVVGLPPMIRESMRKDKSVFDLFFDVTGAVSLSADVKPAMTIAPTFNPGAFGTPLTIIRNDGFDAVGRTAGATFIYDGVRLTEGARFQAGSSFFQLSYVGGDGNDVVMFATVPEPDVPVLCIVFGAMLLSRRTRRLPRAILSANRS